MINLLNKLPIPNLRHYCLFSFSLLSLVALYAYKVHYELRNVIEESAVSETRQTTAEQEDRLSDALMSLNATIVTTANLIATTYRIIVSEPWCVWVLINFSYCCLILFSKIIQMVVFGKLRAVENQHIKDQFWNFIFLKFIFIFGVLNLENISEVSMWCIWFSMIGFLAIHSQICKDRFEFLSFSASTQLKSHVKVLALLLAIQAFCLVLVVASFAYFKTTSYSMNLFMFADSLGLTLRTFYVITRYALHLSDVYNLFEIANKGTVTYYIDFLFEISVILIDLLHYLHMLIYGNFYLSMASLVICMELKRLFFDLKKRLKRHSNYLRVIEKMEKRFPWATAEEMADADKCAVCWEKLDKARRLPCSHIFHHNCLRSWLEQDTSCPKCRKSLQDEKENQQQATTRQPGQPTDPQEPQQPQQQPPQVQRIVHRNLFQFNGSRYISWLPNFSLQVTNGTNVVLPGLLRSRATLEPERLNEMTQQIRTLFPHVPVELVQQDLRVTHSVEVTIENILEDRLNGTGGIPGDNGGGRNANQQTGGGGGGLLAGNDSDVDDDEDEDSDEDLSSTEDDNTATTTNNADANQTANNGERDLRRRNILSRVFDTFNSQSSSSRPTTRGRVQSRTQTRGGGDRHNDHNHHHHHNHGATTSSDENVENEPHHIERLMNDDSAIIAKYATSTSLSDNANILILRKRDLILNSKKRFLEKMQDKNQKQEKSSSSSSNPTPVETDNTSDK